MSSDVIILRQQDAQTTQRLDAFMRAFYAQTVQHPFIHQQRIWNNQVIFEVSKFDGKIHLGCIQAIDLKDGHGSRALKWLTDQGREHSVAIDGTVQRVGHAGMTVSELRTWYKKHGFHVNRQGRILFDPKVEAAHALVIESSAKINIMSGRTP